MNAQAAMARPHTCLRERHEQLGATFTDFGGWDMPLRYGSELEEHRAVREHAGLFDLSHMGEITVRGTGAGALLNSCLVGDLASIAIGRAKYSLLCDGRGGIVDDLIIYRLGDDEYLVVPNAGNAEIVHHALRERSAGFAVAVEDETLTTALIAVQGPAAAAIVRELVTGLERGRLDELRYYAAIGCRVAGTSALLARTGYTGEDGFELFVPAALAPRLWDDLLGVGDAHGMLVCGLASRDSLRLEAGMPLYGQELSLDTDPFAAGLGGVVSFDKPESFTGRAALARLREHGGPRRLVGLASAGRRAARPGYPVIVDGATVGTVTSGLPSPTLRHPIALAYLDAAHSGAGTLVEVAVRGHHEPFEVVKPPFYRRPTRGNA